MKKSLYFAAAAAAALVAASAQAAVLVGSFSISSFGGEYVGGSQTALTATGLDFGFVGGGAGNGYGNNGSALVGDGTGSFAQYNGTFASVSDIALTGLVANANTNPFITLDGLFLPTTTMSFSNAVVTRNTNSVDITGNAVFKNGQDFTNGIFTLSTTTDKGGNSVQLNFQSTASIPAVPEPATWGMMLLGFGVVGSAMRRRNAKTIASFA